MITVKNISKSYKTVRALQDFSYTFENGIYALLGPNGSGKSTLMNIMTGNLKPDMGEIDFEKKNGAIDETVSFVPQYSGMYPHFQRTKCSIIWRF